MNILSSLLYFIGGKIATIYPVGSIYMSVNDVDPSTIFGGTWEKISGRFLLASGDGYNIGATGGEATHILTPAETAVRAHNHTITHGHTFTQPTISDPSKSLTGVLNFRRCGADAPAGAGSGSIVTYTQKGGSSYNNNALQSGVNQNGDKINFDATHKHTASGGAVADYTGYSGNATATNGSAHNNMPPYLVVNVWKRTA